MSALKIVAIDCDLRKIYAYASDGTVVANRVADVRDVAVGTADVVLFEVAGAVDYTDSKSIAYHKRRWTIFNIHQATILDALAGPRLRVAPSSAWTKGYPLAVRHKIAGATGLNKDLRECMTMIDFYRRDPSVWIPLKDFIDRI